MATQIKLQPIPEKILSDTPTQGKILVVPYPPAMLKDPNDAKYRWGSEKRSGYMTIDKKPIEGGDYMGSTLALDGGGLILDMANEGNRLLYIILRHSDQWKGVVSERKDKRYPNSRFYFQNNELEIQEYLKQMRASDEMVDRIRALNPEQIERMALWFGIVGSHDFKKGSLRKMTENENGMKRLQEVLMNPDREIMELVAVAETRGDRNTKMGLWENKQTGVYYWNQESIGLKRDGVITYLKKNTELQAEMRKLYLSEPLVAAAEPQTPKEKTGISPTNTNTPKEQNPVQLKVVDPAAKVVDKTKKGWYIDVEQLKKDYETEKNCAVLGRKYLDPDTGKKTHFKTIEGLLGLI